MLTCWGILFRHRYNASLADFTQFRHYVDGSSEGTCILFRPYTVYIPPEQSPITDAA